MIEQIAKLAPNKPIRWLIGSHPHFDHIGGLRTYNHIGATIVDAHASTSKFLNRDVLTYKRGRSNPTSCRCGRPPRWPRATTTRRSRRTSSSPTTAGSCASITCSRCSTSTGMLMAYLPAERIAFEADLFDTHEAPRPAQMPAMRSFMNQVQRMKLNVATVAPVHGKPVPWSTFSDAVATVSKTN